MFKYGLLIMPFEGKLTVRTGFSPVRCLCISMLPSSLQGSDRLTHGWGQAPSVQLGFGQEINSKGLYSKKMSCMYLILKIAVTIANSTTIILW